MLWKGRPVEVTPLSGGLTNENYLVETGGERYVMRLPGQSTELLSIDRANEVFNTKAAATTRIGPNVLEHVADTNVMVLEFIPGLTMSAQTLQSPRMAARMAQSFHRLHAAPRFLHDFNMFRLIEDYLRIVDEHDVQIPGRDRAGGSGRRAAHGALPQRPSVRELHRRRKRAAHRRLRAERQQ